ncbi:MAG: hypothetical protein R3A10_11430 [Caldilineaceae bacterium]
MATAHQALDLEMQDGDTSRGKSAQILQRDILLANWHDGQSPLRRIFLHATGRLIGVCGFHLVAVDAGTQALFWPHVLDATAAGRIRPRLV